MSFIENLFTCWLIVAGLLLLLAVCHVVGLGVMRIRDQRTGKKRLFIIRREG